MFTAATLEEAREAAIKEFGAAEAEIKFSIIEEPKKGLFGKLKGEAKIEAEYEPPVVLTKAEIAKNYMLDVIKAMGIENAEIDTEDTESGAMFEIKSEEFESLIGRKGELLDALQYLSSLICNKIDRDYYRISTDCNGFRERRKEQLEGLARKIAANVKRSGRTSALEPMNPYERRIIHAAVSEIDGVTSHSTGDEPYRKVIISSTEKKPRGDRGDFRKGGKRGQRRDRRPREHFDITTSFEKDYKRPKPEDTLNAGLYGKIEF